MKRCARQIEQCTPRQQEIVLALQAWDQKPLTLEDIAAQVGWSKSTVHRDIVGYKYNGTRRQGLIEIGLVEHCDPYGFRVVNSPLTQEVAEKMYDWVNEAGTIDPDALPIIVDLAVRRIVETGAYHQVQTAKNQQWRPARHETWAGVGL